MSRDGAVVPERDPAHDREALRAAFDASDPDLLPQERETLFRFARDQDRLRFFTSEPGIGRRLIAHGHASVEEVVVREGGARPARPTEAVDKADHVVGVRGTLPIGALSISGDPRRSDQHAAVVSDAVLREGDK
jgi:hypothetical protein